MLTSLQLGWDSNSGTLALVYGLSHSAVLSVTSWAVLASYWPQIMQVCCTSHDVRAERDWKKFVLSQNGIHTGEWSSMHGNLGRRFPLKTRKDFLSWQSHPAKERLFWAGTSPSITKTSNISWCLRGSDVVEGVQGLDAELAWVLSEVFRHE